MSQKFDKATINTNDVEYVRFTQDMDIKKLIDFIGADMTVTIQSGQVSLSEDGPYDQAFIVLEEDDYIVRLFGEIEVFVFDEFHDHFTV